MITETELKKLPWTTRLIRLAVGLAFLTAFVGLIISGVTPPGISGEVLRHNRAVGIDASPLFYTDVEHMAELETAASQQLRSKNSPD